MVTHVVHVRELKEDESLIVMRDLVGAPSVMSSQEFSAAIGPRG